MIKMLRSDDVWQPKLGAPRGNRNARRTGPHDRDARLLRKRIAAFRRRAKALMLQAETALDMASRGRSAANRSGRA